MAAALGGLQRLLRPLGPTALARAITETTWSRFFDGYEPVHGLVAESGGELLGLTHYLYHRSTTLIEPICYLQDLFTTEAARGKGVGRALIERVYREAKAAGSPRVYWQTHETNATARCCTTRSRRISASSSIARMSSASGLWISRRPRQQRYRATQNPCFCALASPVDK